MIRVVLNATGFKLNNIGQGGFMDLNKYKQQTAKPEVLDWLDRNLRNYLAKNEEDVGEIEHIIDYLNSPESPTRLTRMSYIEAKNNSATWLKQLIKKGNEIVEQLGDIRVEIDFKDGFNLVELVGKSAYEREGSLMSHCVSSYSDRDCKVYSLRDAENKPHCTIEVNEDGDGINQIKGKGNGSIHPKYINYIMFTLKHFGLDVRDSEMSNLGYTNLDSVVDGFTDFVKSNTNGAKFFKMNGKEYFYNDSKLGEKS